jgi:hypothetical protein
MLRVQFRDHKITKFGLYFSSIEAVVMVYILVVSIDHSAPYPEARYLPSLVKERVKMPALWPVRSAVFSTDRLSVQ